MPLPPKPQTFTCQACGWTKTTIPRSDCLTPGVDWLNQCGKCGAAELGRQPASPFEIVKARLKAGLGAG